MKRLIRAVSKFFRTRFGWGHISNQTLTRDELVELMWGFKREGFRKLCVSRCTITGVYENFLDDDMPIFRPLYVTDCIVFGGETPQ